MRLKHIHLKLSRGPQRPYDLFLLEEANLESIVELSAHSEFTAPNC